MADYALARLDEIELVGDGTIAFHAVRQHFGIETFGITAKVARDAGDRLIYEHDETEPDSSEELYIVVSGHARFVLAGEEREAPAGTLVHVAPGVTREAFAREGGTTVLAISGGPAGEPYVSSGWERFFPLFALFESGDYEQGADRAGALLAEHPESGAAVYYNAACFESGAGRTELALQHLRHAVEHQPAIAELARDDEDFASLRALPEFAEIVGGQ